MNELALLDGQIEKAEAQIRRLDQLIVNPVHPLTPEAEIRYIAMLAETEAELKHLVKKRAQQQVNQNPSEVIPDFYQIIAQLSSNFSRLSVDHQKLVTRQVIRAIRINRVSPHLFLLSVVWQNGIAACPDVATHLARVQAKWGICAVDTQRGPDSADALPDHEADRPTPGTSRAPHVHDLRPSQGIWPEARGKAGRSTPGADTSPDRHLYRP